MIFFDLAGSHDLIIYLHGVFVQLETIPFSSALFVVEIPNDKNKRKRNSALRQSPAPKERNVNSSSYVKFNQYSHLKTSNTKSTLTTMASRKSEIRLGSTSSSSHRSMSPSLW